MSSPVRDIQSSHGGAEKVLHTSLGYASPVFGGPAGSGAHPRSWSNARLMLQTPKSASIAYGQHVSCKDILSAMRDDDRPSVHSVVSFSSAHTPHAFLRPSHAAAHDGGEQELQSFLHTPTKIAYTPHSSRCQSEVQDWGKSELQSSMCTPAGNVYASIESALRRSASSASSACAPHASVSRRPATSQEPDRGWLQPPTPLQGGTPPSASACKILGHVSHSTSTNARNHVPDDAENVLAFHSVGCVSNRTASSRIRPRCGHALEEVTDENRRGQVVGGLHDEHDAVLSSMSSSFGRGLKYATSSEDTQGRGRLVGESYDQHGAIPSSMSSSFGRGLRYATSSGDVQGRGASAGVSPDRQGVILSAMSSSVAQGLGHATSSMNKHVRYLGWLQDERDATHSSLSSSFSRGLGHATSSGDKHGKDWNVDGFQDRQGAIFSSMSSSFVQGLGHGTGVTPCQSKIGVIHSERSLSAWPRKEDGNEDSRNDHGVSAFLSGGSSPFRWAQAHGSGNSRREDVINLFPAGGSSGARWTQEYGKEFSRDENEVSFFPPGSSPSVVLGQLLSRRDSQNENESIPVVRGRQGYLVDADRIAMGKNDEGDAVAMEAVLEGYMTALGMHGESPACVRLSTPIRRPQKEEALAAYRPPTMHAAPLGLKGRRTPDNSMNMWEELSLRANVVQRLTGTTGLNREKSSKARQEGSSAQNAKVRRFCQGMKFGAPLDMCNRTERIVKYCD